jgi:hypothetical protein
MELKLKRYILTDKSTISDLFIDGHYFCKTLEDTDRGLTSTMSLDEIKKIKVWGQTAIPKGRYEVVISYSNKFKRLLPELLNVPGYGGIRIHVGNRPQDTEGCILPGNWFYEDQVINSKATFTTLFQMMQSRAKKEKIFITVE